MKARYRAGAAVAAMAAMAALTPQARAAQAEGVEAQPSGKTSENAVTQADDAFGTNVGIESSGIYNENDARGFSPLKAGNARLDGVYFDPVAPMTNRLRTGNAIRIGFAAIDYPFPAPTGIVDNSLRTVGAQFGADVSAMLMPYGGGVMEANVRVPLHGDRLGVAAGFSYGLNHQVDGSVQEAYAGMVKPVVRVGNVEVSPFIAITNGNNAQSRPLTIVSGDFLPGLPPQGRYLGQRWARNVNTGTLYGVTVKAPISTRLSLRAGVFNSRFTRERNFTELFGVLDAAGNASHRLLADPQQTSHALSGELQLAWHLTGGPVEHRVIAGFRGRNRHTQAGGSDVLDFGRVTYGEQDPELQPAFRFRPLNESELTQTSFMLGYMGAWRHIARVNLGIQKTDYRAESRDSRGLTTSRDSTWLVNAALAVNLADNLSFFVGTEHGLEDSGSAPENAINRNEQLAATRTSQYEAGLRWKLGRSHLLIGAFQIRKPYFSFDAGNRFVELGEERHRGIELSLVGNIGSRLNVLAGAVLMQPEVTGAGRDAGLVGSRPTGTPSQYVRVDANYRPGLWEGFTLTSSAIFQGRRAVGARPQATLGGDQLMLPSRATLDIGFRQQWRVGGKPVSLRFTLNNIFDNRGWRVVSANTLMPDDSRRIFAVLSVDLF